MYVYVWSSDCDGMELSPKDNQRGSSDLMMDGNCRRKTLRGVIRPTEGTGSSVETTTRGQQTSGWALPSLQGVIRSTDGTCQQLQGIGWRPLEQDKTASDGDGGPSSKTKRLAIGMEAPSSKLGWGNYIAQGRHGDNVRRGSSCPPCILWEELALGDTG